MGKKVVIALTVQASSLYAMSNPSQKDIDSTCSLSDDNSGRSSNGTLKDFLSNVYLNQDVRWIGLTNDNGYSVAIDSIFNEPESRDMDFFDVTTIYGSGGRSPVSSFAIRHDVVATNSVDFK